MDPKKTAMTVILSLTAFILTSYVVQSIFNVRLFAYGILINVGIIFALVAFISNQITQGTAFTKADLIPLLIMTAIGIAAIFILPRVVPEMYSVLINSGIATPQAILGVPFP